MATNTYFDSIVPRALKADFTSISNLSNTNPNGGDLTRLDNAPTQFVYHKLDNKKENVISLNQFIGRAVDLPEHYEGNKSITFDTDSNTLDVVDKKTLEPILNYLIANPDTNVSVEGHTDTRGSREYNQALSELRTSSTLEYLLTELEKRGVENPTQRIRVEHKSTGEDNLVVQTPNNTDLVDNRSVEIHFYPKEQEIAKYKNITHVYDLSGKAPDSFLISPQLSPTEIKYYKDHDKDHTIVSGKAVVLISDSLEKQIPINFEDVSAENLNNVQFLFKNENSTSHAKFVKDDANHQIHLVTTDAHGKKRDLAVIQMNAETDLNAVKVGHVGPAGKAIFVDLEKNFAPLSPEHVQASTMSYALASSGIKAQENTNSADVPNINVPQSGALKPTTGINR